jgi:hypothetical protein
MCLLAWTCGDGSAKDRWISVMSLVVDTGGSEGAMAGSLRTIAVARRAYGD